VKIRSLGADYPRQLELFARGEIAGLLSAEPNGALGEYRGIVRSWGDVFSLAKVPRLQWVMCGRRLISKSFFNVAADWSGTVMCPAC
jgi:hypothetical protein